MSAAEPCPAARAGRTSARVALWSALALTAAVAFLLGRYSRPIPAAGYRPIEPEQELWQGIDFLDYEEVRLLQSYVRIDSSYPDPDEAAGAEFLAAQLAAAGIPSTIERFPDRRANVWAFVEGEDPRAVVLLGHLDVEPASEQEGWIFPPFAAAVRGPWIYGRGMYDMKSLTIAQLLATIDAASSGKKPARSLLFLQTSSEETDSELGMRWILAEHPELVARMDTVLTEGGVVEATSPTEVKYWGIEFAQRASSYTTFCSPDREALLALRRLLVETRATDRRSDIDPAVLRFLASYGPSRDFDLYHRILTEPHSITRRPGYFDPLPPYLKSLFRSELAPLAVAPAQGGGWELRVWLNRPPGHDFETAATELLPAWKTAGFATTPWVHVATAKASDLDHADYAAIERTTAEHFPSVPVGPFFLVQAATDARVLRDSGIRAYGFSPFPLVVLDTLQIAKPNERMQLPAFRLGASLYRQVVSRLVD